MKTHGGFFSPDAAIWKVDREMVLLLAGGRALLMQIAHPKIAAGVAEHSRFDEDPLGRLHRTMGAMWSIVFDESAQAQAALERIKATHLKVRGAVPAAEGGGVARYDALDPELLLWVHATLIDSAMKAYEVFVRPLSPQEQSRYYEDTKKLASLFEIPEPLVPTTSEDFAAYVQRMLAGDRLRVGANALDLAEKILRPAPWVLKLASPWARVLTAGLLPERLRREFDLHWQDKQQKAFARLVKLVRLLLPVTPRLLRIVPNARRAERRFAGVRQSPSRRLP